MPELRIVRRSEGLGTRGYLTAYVVDPETGDPVRSMACFGGNYVATCDSRMPGDSPIPIHDRIMGPDGDDRTTTEALTARVTEYWDRKIVGDFFRAGPPEGY
jgi:hypothetical protein